MTSSLWVGALVLLCVLMPCATCCSTAAVPTTAALASNLRDRGYVVVAQPIMPISAIEDARHICQSRLKTLLSEVQAAGCDPVEQMFRFDQICHRQRNRWDLLMPSGAEGSPVWTALLEAAVDAATPIIREAQGDAFTSLTPLMSGAVVSRPGARVQRFHCDATHKHFAAAAADPAHRIYNVFIPLVPIEADGDGTMFWPAPLLDEATRALAKHLLDAPDSTLDPSAIDAPATDAGGMLIFDYRTIHRGLDNPTQSGRERPVAYVALASGGASDTHNFPPLSIRDADRETLEALPYWNRSSVAQDALEYWTEIEGADEFAIGSA